MDSELLYADDMGWDLEEYFLGFQLSNAMPDFFGGNPMDEWGDISFDLESYSDVNLDSFISEPADMSYYLEGTYEYLHPPELSTGDEFITSLLSDTSFQSNPDSFLYDPTLSASYDPSAGINAAFANYPTGNTPSIGTGSDAVSRVASTAASVLGGGGSSIGGGGSSASKSTSTDSILTSIQNALKTLLGTDTKATATTTVKPLSSVASTSTLDTSGAGLGSFGLIAGVALILYLSMKK